MEELHKRDSRGQVKIKIYKGLRERFLGKFIRLDSGCWKWTGNLTEDGYGAIWYRNRNVRAHRVAYELFVGSIPNGHLICHHCDNRWCVNPQHLFAGTHKDNLVDMGQKGRQRLQIDPKSMTGKNNHQSKLTNNDVQRIKSLLRKGGNQSAIAREHGVSPDAINKIARGHNWSHIS